MTNWGAIEKNRMAWELIESAGQRWGRKNLLDGPTQLAPIVSKTEATSICYVVEALCSQMWRTNAADPYGAAELKRVIPEIMFARLYVRGFGQTEFGRDRCGKQTTQKQHYAELSGRTARSHFESNKNRPFSFRIKQEPPVLVSNQTRTARSCFKSNKNRPFSFEIKQEPPVLV